MRRFNAWYWFTGHWIWSALAVFFRRRQIVYLHDVPFEGPLIFSPNHQNAFLDALVAVVPAIFNVKQTGFMIRSDVFKSKAVSAFLKSLKMYPAYRMRDGIENLSKNENTFQHSYELLGKWNEGIIIFPEANHAVPRKLRTLKKGQMRVAFGAEKAYPNLNLKIIPMGLNYSDPHHFGGEVLILFGEAIDVNKYLELFDESEPKAYNALREEVEKRMRPLMIDIRNDDYYQEIEAVLIMSTNSELGRKAELKAKFDHQKQVISKMEAWLEQNPENQVKDWVGTYSRTIKKKGLRDWVLDHERISFGSTLWQVVKLIVCLGPALAGILVNYIPFTTPARFAKKKIKDPGFRSSIAVGMAMFLFPIWYLILMIVAFFVLPEWYYSFLVPPAAMISGGLALVFIRAWNRLRGMLRYNALVRKNDKDLLAALEARKNLLNIIKEG